MPFFKNRQEPSEIAVQYDGKIVMDFRNNSFSPA